MSAGTPVALRMAHEIPKTLDWQAFQRNCALLFRDELRDPHIQEYGRNGQNQRGIDLVARRNGDPALHVGVQCRNVNDPLSHADILKDCRAALTFPERLTEIIFATTAPDDRHATDAASRVERTFRDEGHDVRVVIYGWGQLRRLIALHDLAYSVFFPSSLATSAPQPTMLAAPDPAISSLSAQMAQLSQQLSSYALPPPPRETGTDDAAAEDPKLHRRIDAYRDMFKDDRLPALAEKGLLGLLKLGGLEAKPWARFRIETNLGSIAVELGRDAEAAVRYETAHAIRPSDPNALANLALARTFQGRYGEAMELAREALSGTPRADHAVGYLIQAAARSGWEGDPEAMIPADLAGNVHADLGLAEFYRWRHVPGWQERCRKLARRHPDMPEFKAIGALAVLALAVESETTVPGGIGPVTADELAGAADDMKAACERLLDIGFVGAHDRVAQLNNACVLLRMCGRNAEVEALLRQAMPTVAGDPQLRRLLALALAGQGRRREALETLAGDPDPENILFGAELSATDDAAGALDRVLAIGDADLSANLASLRWHIVAETALTVVRPDALQLAVDGLRSMKPDDPVAELYELRGKRQAGLGDHELRHSLRALAAGLPPETQMTTRYFVALDLRELGLAAEASTVLENRVDLSRRTPTTLLFLQSLAAARRDDAFQTALGAASRAVRDDPDVLWTAAAHSWNVGDLDGALQVAEALLIRDPESARITLFKLEILVRQDKSGELLAQLERPLERLAWTRMQDRFRIASLLGHFGFVERAAAVAYKLFLEHPDNSQAWTTLARLVLDEGMGDALRPRLWAAPAVAADTAIDLEFDDGGKLFFVVEPDPSLRKLDAEAWEPDHLLARALTGMPKEARFVAPDGRAGTIKVIRHKYVARLHYIMEHHESRFPEEREFRKITVTPGAPGGFDEMMAQLKARRDWFEQEQEQYVAGPWSMGVLAHRLGLDTIEVATGLASQGVRLKVALGNESERQAAVQAVRENSAGGCVLDLHAFWTAWRLQALGVIVATCGAVRVCQSTVDRLRLRRERLGASARDGHKSASYDDGRMAVQELAPEVVREWIEDIDRALAWLGAHATVCPLVVGDAIPAELRELISSGRTDIHDSLALAMQSGLLLVTDDRPLRELGYLLGHRRSSWTHFVLSAALERKRLDLDDYVRLTADLVDAGHDYIGVAGRDLARALLLDARSGNAPGRRFRSLSGTIGCRTAEPLSHIAAVVGCLSLLWDLREFSPHRKAATSLLMRQLLRWRHDDHGHIVRGMLQTFRGFPELSRFLLVWAQGHFIPAEKIWGEQRAVVGRAATPVRRARR